MRWNKTSRWLHWLIVPVACLVLLPVASVGAKAAVAPIGVANAASYDAAVAPGSIAALFGTNMTGLSEASAQSLPLPTVLAGLSVKVNGLTAPLFYASAGQINFQVPSGVDSGTATVRSLLVQRGCLRHCPGRRVRAGHIQRRFEWQKPGRCTELRLLDQCRLRSISRVAA